MQKRKFLKPAVLSAALIATTSAAAFAQEAETSPPPAEEETPVKPKSELRANFRRVALDLLSTEVTNAEEYQDSSVTALSANSEKIVRGVFDFALEYERTHMRWDNRIFMDYGRRTTKAIGTPKVVDENADEITFTTDYTQKIWEIRQADLGPFASLAYQTEFTDDKSRGAPRNKIVRGTTGLRLLNATYMPNIHAALVGEADFTRSKTVKRYAWEVGFEAVHDFKEGVKFRGEGYYRQFFYYSEFIAPDLRYDLNLVGRMEVEIYRKVSLSPFVSYRMAKARGAENHGSNFMIGLSLSYADIFKIW